MSYQIGIDTIHLRPTPRIAHTEYVDSQPLVHAVTGESSSHSATRAFNNAWDVDLIWMTQDGPVAWGERGRVTDMGHAEFVAGGTDRREKKPSPFKTPEEVWTFDAVAEYGLPDFDTLVDYYQAFYTVKKIENPDQVCTGGYYKTIISGAIEAFGWDMLLLAASEQEKFERVLDSIYRLSLHHFRAWAQTSIEVFICHDDMVWSQGPFMRPAFYRRVIFPRYRELWAVLKQAGKKVLYCSDGYWSMFMDDIVAAGADGFIFEPMMELEPVVEKYGQTHAIVASKVDCRTLAHGTQEQIKMEVDATLALARNCPGFMFAVGNHMPADIPLQSALFYFDHLRSQWQR